MTKTASVVPLQQVQHIQTALLQEAEWNARKTFDRVALDELIASIDEHGIQSPLIVRLSIDRDSYEVVCGHRRLKAACLAGLKTVPCIVRELSDDKAREIGLVDNLQRVDVPAIEEAEGFGELLTRLGSIAAVATKVGKEQSYVAKRLKLRTLTLWSEDALRGGLITIDHALLLARLAEAEQDETLKWTLDHNAGSKKPVGEVLVERLKAQDERRDPESHSYGWLWEPQSVARLKGHIEEKAGIHLDRAPWPMEEDHLLPDAGSCLDCPKNTKANTPLFGDLAIGEPTCTDGACFQAKTFAFVEIKRREAGHDENAKPKKRVPRLSWKFSSVRPKTGFNDDPHQGSMNTCADVSKVIKAGAWVEAKKNSCPNVRPGVTVDWSDGSGRGYMGSEKKLRKPGETLLVCIACGCKVHKKEYEKTKQETAGPRNENTAEAAAERLRKAELAKVENVVRAGLVRAAMAKVDKLAGPILRRLVLMALPDEWDRNEDAAEMFPGLDKAVGSSKTDSVEFAKAASSVLFIRERSDVWVDEWESADAGRKEFIALLKDLGYDASKAWDKPAEPKAAKKAAAKPAPKKPAKKAAKKKGGRK